MSEINVIDVHPAAAESNTSATSHLGRVAQMGQAQASPPGSLLTIAAITTEQAALSRRIGCGLTIPVSHVGSDAVLSMYMAPKAPTEWSESVFFYGSFGAIEVEQGARLIRGLSGIDLSREQLERGDEYGWLQAAVLGRLGGTPFGSIDRIADSGEIPTDAVVLRMVLSTGNHAISVHAKGNPSVWMDFLSHVEWVHEKRSHSRLPSLPLRLPVTLAHHSLPAAELRRLSVGDVIQPSNPRFTCDAKGIVSLGSIAMHVRYLAPCKLEILKMENKLDDQYMEQFDDDEAGVEDTDMADDGDDIHAYDDEMETPQDEQAGYANAAKDSGGHNVGKVPITLDFTLGHVRLTLDEVGTLGAGSVLTIEGGSPASVAITANGEVLGLGEAVDVNGQLGIRIVQWG